MGLKDFFFYWSKKVVFTKKITRSQKRSPPKNNKVQKRFTKKITRSQKRSPKDYFSRTEGANTGHRRTRERKMRGNGDSRMVFGKINEAFEPIRVGFVALLQKFEEKCSQRKKHRKHFKKNVARRITRIMRNFLGGQQLKTIENNY